jgi:hypothetical protein
VRFDRPQADPDTSGTMNFLTARFTGGIRPLPPENRAAGICKGTALAGKSTIAMVSTTWPG